MGEILLLQPMSRVELDVDKNLDTPKALIYSASAYVPRDGFASDTLFEL
jgi:hypothetical protein